MEVSLWKAACTARLLTHTFLLATLPTPAKSNSKADAAKAKAAEAERKKAEKAALLAAEEASLPSKPKPQVTGAAAKKKAAPTQKAKEKESIRPAGPGALAAGGGLASVDVNKEEDKDEEGTVHLAATGLDNMLEALELVHAKTDKSSLGSKVCDHEFK